ncbi:uncharacterized protein C8R40DRAFT_1056377, partial [Lentinula edodes]|uniref:uncharacterized protein n=1 Tax=Lentinula edodes TaxID=5353 RepID=UPI001E8CD812
HPATGWFITHGGWNSIQEVFFHRVPLILWPCQADQPYNAILMSRNHQAAFELISVRTGDRGCAYPTNSKMPSFTPESAKEKFRALLN